MAYPFIALGYQGKYPAGYFLLGFFLILTARADNMNYLIGCVFLAISLYAYGEPHVAAPVFLSCATVILLASKWASAKIIISGSILFAPLITPLIVHSNEHTKVGIDPVGLLNNPTLAGTGSIRNGRGSI